MQIIDSIKVKIQELEQIHDIRILFACESGSRAWGFPSPDSDYDARFIYMHPQDWYLSIYEKRDVLELPVDKVLDINGWDLRKTLRLLYKHNAVIAEWIQSPIVYSSDDAFVREFWEVAKACFSAKAAMYHYMSSAVRHYEECLGDVIKLKKLLYCLRATLAALWIAYYNTIPPMELEPLLAVIKEQSVVSKIRNLVVLKTQKDEAYLHPREPVLDDFLKEQISYCKGVAHSLPDSRQCDEGLLNEFFRSMLQS